MSERKSHVALEFIAMPSWVPLGAWEAYSDEVLSTANGGGKECLDRLVTRDEMKDFYVKFRETFQYIDWRVFLSACREAIELPYQEMHDAFKKAKGLSKKIAPRAAALAKFLEEYRDVCVAGRVDVIPMIGGLFAATDEPWNYDGRRLIDGLAQLAAECDKHEHTCYGTGKESWGSRIQATDLVPQFVRFVSARLKTNYADQMPDLTGNDLARLAVASLNIRATKNDYLGMVEGRIKKL